MRPNLGNASAVAVCALVLGLCGEARSCEPVLITNQPQSVVVLLNCQAAFRIEVSGTAPDSFQWWRNGERVPDATNAVYITSPVVSGDDGAAFFATVTNGCGSITSRAAVLHVSLEVVPLRLTNALSGPVLDQVTLNFAVAGCPAGPDDGLDPLSANDTFSYSISGGVEVLGAALQSDGHSVVLSTSPQTEGALYTVTANGVTDRAGNPVPVDDQASFRTGVASRGFLLFETWDKAPGALCANVYPSQPPRERRYLTAFDSRTVYPDNSHENYCSRISGYFIPPVSGNWVFYLRSEDDSQLFLNPDGKDRAGRILLQQEESCCHTFSAHGSAPLSLTAGMPYYIEALHTANTGGDYIQVAAKLATDSTNQDALPPIPGAYLAAVVNPEGASVSISVQPQDRVVDRGSIVTFSVSATASTLPIFYQWQQLDPDQTNWIDVPGANEAVYSFLWFSTCGGTRYRCLVSIPGAEAFSAAARVSVACGDPPVIYRAIGSATLEAVTVMFSDFVTAESAGDLFNYNIAGLSVVDISVDDSYTVTLQTSRQTPGAAYTITVNGVRDLSDPVCGCGVIIPNSQITFTAWAARLDAQRAADSLRISWDYVATLQGYFLESAPELQSRDWTRVTPDPVTGDGRSVVEPPIGESPRFYRLRKE